MTEWWNMTEWCSATATMMARQQTPKERGSRSARMLTGDVEVALRNQTASLEDQQKQTPLHGARPVVPASCLVLRSGRRASQTIEERTKHRQQQHSGEPAPASDLCRLD